MSMRRFMAATLVVGAVAPAVVLTGCGDYASTGDGSGEGTSTIIRVPADHPTIQGAVDAAAPGDLVLISRGTYREEVTVSTPRIVIRGLDRNRVILDGGNALGNGITVQADGVAVENLTARRYLDNGVLVNGAHTYTSAAYGRGERPSAGDGVPGEDDMRAAGATPGAGDDVVAGYRVSYVTAHNNGLYGIYAFASRDGLIEHTYTSGNPDSGIYIGQCKPCNAVVRDSIMRVNAIGYFGTNTNGGVTVIDSDMSDNRLGVALNSDDAEMLAPARGTVMVGNRITGNDNAKAPAIEEGFSEGGIGIAGGRQHVIERNLIAGNGAVGVLVTDQGRYRARGNRVRSNVLRDHGFDLVATATTPGCFSGSAFSTSDPANIEQVFPCSGARTAPPVRTGYRTPSPPPPVDYRAIPAPPVQPQMPSAASAPARPATDMPPPVNPGTLEVPAG